MNQETEHQLERLMVDFGGVCPYLEGFSMVETVGEQALEWSQDGRHELAKEFLVRAMNICGRELGAVHPDTLAIVSGAALTLGWKPQYWDFVEVLLINSLMACEGEFGREHVETLRMREELALAAGCRGDHCSAEMMLGQMLEKRERALGLGHPDVIRNLQFLALGIYRHGEPERAAEFLRGQIYRRERVLSSDDLGLRELRWMLGDILGVDMRGLARPA